ncbi:hypothetical protein MCHI_001373, partial [Candidatus Magnetoovum chiemensis]
MAKDDDIMNRLNALQPNVPTKTRTRSRSKKTKPEENEENKKEIIHEAQLVQEDANSHSEAPCENGTAPFTKKVANGVSLSLNKPGYIVLMVESLTTMERLRHAILG